MNIRIALLFFLGLLNNPYVSFSQDSIPIANDLEEEKELKFKEYFFKALSEKSISNYQKSIENLENCNQTIPNNVAVFFEFSKNYLLLNNTLEAKEYINKALEKDPTNIWMLKHLVKIYTKEHRYKNAITIQKKIVTQHRKEKEYLARLYFQNKDYKNTTALINEIEKESGLSTLLKRIRDSITSQRTPQPTKTKPTDDLTALLNQFKHNKSFEVLKQILNKLEGNSALLLSYCEEGLALFPAQPLLYLTKGKALNEQKYHKEALQSLQNGIDFVFEQKMEAQFYIEIANSYKGLGNLEKEKIYRLKSKKVTD